MEATDEPGTLDQLRQLIFEFELQIERLARLERVRKRYAQVRLVVRIVRAVAVALRPEILAIAARADHGQLLHVDVAVLVRFVSAASRPEGRAQEQRLVVLERVQIQMKPKLVQRRGRTIHEMDRLTTGDAVQRRVELGFDFVGGDLRPRFRRALARAGSAVLRARARCWRRARAEQKRFQEQRRQCGKHRSNQQILRDPSHHFRFRRAAQPPREMTRCSSSWYMMRRASKRGMPLMSRICSTVSPPSIKDSKKPAR